MKQKRVFPRCQRSFPFAKNQLNKNKKPIKPHYKGSNNLQYFNIFFKKIKMDSLINLQNYQVAHYQYLDAIQKH